MLAGISAAKSAGTATAEAYADQLARIRALDGSLGAPATVGQLTALSKSITTTLTHIVRPEQREPLATVLADATSLAAWQALDLGDIRQAWSLFETSKSAAREAGDTASLTHAMGEQAYVLSDIGAAAEAAELARAARDTAHGKVPRLLTAWLAAVEAELCAACQDSTAARRALDDADRQITQASGDWLSYIFLDEPHMTRRCGHILARLGDPDAIAVLLEARGIADTTYTRATASLECDISNALLIVGERREAIEHAAQARTLARASGSVRQLRRVEALSRDRPEQPDQGA